VTRTVVSAALVTVLLGCQGGVEGQDGGDVSVLPTPTVSFDVRGIVTDEVPEGQPDRFMMEVLGEGPFNLGDDAVVVFDTSMLRCASGEDVETSPLPGEQVWLQEVGGISESDPPILHPETVVLDC
jgi:hypothetical protein